MSILEGHLLSGLKGIFCYNRLRCIPLIFAGLIMTSCLKEDSIESTKPERSEGFSEGISELIVVNEVLTALENNGMVIYEGKNPPYIEGVYYASPLEFQSGGRRSLDMMVLLKNQDTSKVSGKKEETINLQRKVIDYETGEVTSTDEHIGYVSGHDNKFSIIISTEENNVEVYSGEIISGGIKNFYFAIWNTVENTGFVLRNKDGNTEKKDGMKFTLQ